MASRSSVDGVYQDRVTAKWVSGIWPGGFHLISVHLWTAEGLTHRNNALLQHLSLITRGLSGPWIAAGDWNVEPSVLQAAGWPHHLRSQIFAPDAATCGDRCYDYFLVSVSGARHARRAECH